ncbi:MAG: sulfatase-like hydrolase/transferase [Bryobacterales bacterium]|nr:sulfatase-like hydrolase/transferase [Bryobacterales bacterium]
MANWDRRSFCRALAAGTLAGSLSRGSAPAQTSERPNIIYILADDLGWGDLGCYNAQSAIPTPHADRMAAEGARFVDMHSPSAVCTPTRYGVLTGRYAWRTRLKSGVLWGYSPNLIESGRITVPRLLREAGYHTAGIGKWHLGLGDRDPVDYAQPLRPGPLDHGFVSYFGIPASLDMPPYVYLDGDRVVEAPTAMIHESTRPRGVFWRGGARSPSFEIDQVHQTFTRRAVEFIQLRGGPGARTEPFFLYLPLASPHTPWLPGKEFRGRSKAGDYGDFVTQVDDTIGQVMAALRETNQDRDTLVIFTSDNGADWKITDKERYAHRANAAWKGEKADVWEGGHRVPFLARWPGRIPAGSVRDDLGCLTDLLATVAALMGQSLPSQAGEDSFNLLPAMLGKASAPARSSVVHHSMNGMFAIREGDWKLALGLGSGGFTAPAVVDPAPGGPVGQLFNLKDDPGELHNLYQKHPDIVERMTATLRRLQEQGHSRPME